MNTQKCPFNHEKLAAYASGNIDPKDRVTVERHLAQCAICRKEVRILEQTWWTLDTWSFETETIQPRLDDLKRRIALSKQTKSFWSRVADIGKSWQVSFRPVPALAMATLACLLFLVPFMQTETTGNNPGPALANQSVVAKPTPSSPVAKAVSASLKKTDGKTAKRVDDKQRDQQFAEALQPGQVNRAAIGINNPDDVGNVDSSRGFVPNADVYTAHYSNVPNQPSVMMDRNMKGQTVSLGY